MSESLEFVGVDDYFQSSAKELPVWGKVRRFPDSLNAAVSLALIKMQHYAQQPGATAEGGLGIAARILGDNASEQISDAVLGEGGEAALLADGVPPELTEHVTQTLITWHLRGRAAAVEVFAKPMGEGEPPNRVTRRAAAKGTARKARTGSTAGTTARGRQAARRSPGARSSTASS